MADDRSSDTATPRPTDAADDSSVGDVKDGKDAKDPKGRKRLFGLVKKKTGDSAKTDVSEKTDSSVDAPPVPRDSSKLTSIVPSTTSPSQTETAHFFLPSSPPRGFTNSPRMSSPAHSQIFERDVQDNSGLKPNSPAIPTHIQTENHIPPVLDDASEAITNRKLDPDSVEIVTHSSHQPASVTVTGTGIGTESTPYDQAASEWAEELASFADRDAMGADNASNYGNLDMADVRRLSFISFADVVQSEHVSPGAGLAGSRESVHLGGLTSLPPASLNRSPSPIRSPVSSQGPGTSPPTSNPGSMKGVEMSPSRKPMGSPGSGHHTLNPPGDLNIETMSQALRRTGSADLSHVRSLPTSPVDLQGPR